MRGRFLATLTTTPTTSNVHTRRQRKMVNYEQGKDANHIFIVG